MQRVRKLVLKRTRGFSPMLGVVKPVRPISDERPASHMGDSSREGVDITVEAIAATNMLGEPVIRDAAARRQEAEDVEAKLGVGERRNLTVVRDLRRFPQALDLCAT